MIDLYKKELKGIYYFAKRNYNELVVIGLATLFLTIARYHPIGPPWVNSLIYFAVLPIITIIVLLRRNPLDFGLRFGNWRIWLFHVALVFTVGLPILYFSSRISSLEGYYTIGQFDLLKYSVETIAYMFAWEFLFRGFLIFGLKEKLGELSILVQMIPFAILHFGKPEVETISTILVGIYLGYVVYRGNSYWPALIIHLFINITFRVIVNIL